MWQPLTDDRFGLMRSFSDSIVKAVRANPRILPNLHEAKTITVTSDYSGQHKASKFESYAFLFVNLDGLPEWESQRQVLRRTHRTEGRRVSFKKLGDTRKQRMLPDFLQAANMLPGLCGCVLIEKDIPSMFRKEGPLDFSEPELAQCVHYPRGSFEKLLRVVHLISFFLAGLTRPGQNILWFTDQDDIAANVGGLIELTRIWGNILGHYLQHNVGHIRCGTTASDDGSFQIEDLAAIPDLVAGALADAMNAYITQGALPSNELFAPPPKDISSKARDIIGWLSAECWPLRRLVYSFQASPGTTAITIKRLRFHGIGMFA